MLYQNLRSIGSGLMVRSTSNFLDLLSFSLLFFLPSFLFSLLSFFFLLPIRFFGFPLPTLSLWISRFWLPLSTRILTSSHLHLFLHFLIFSSFGSHSSKPSSTSLKTWESGEVGVWGDPLSPTMFFDYFFYFIF